MFTVTLVFVKNGRRARWTHKVAAVPGVDVFRTAERVYARTCKKGRPALVPGASRCIAA